ncbi:hypothetical protein NQ318_014745, partial [Aromia moschata]
AYKEARRVKDPGWHDDILPAVKPYSKLLLRLVVVIKKKATNRVHVLLSERNSWHLPACEVYPTKSIHSTLRRFMYKLFGHDVPLPQAPRTVFGELELEVQGQLVVEYDPSTDKEGVCLTLLVAFRSPLEEVPIIGKCVWHETSKELSDKLLQRVAARNSTFPLHVIK